MKIFVKNALRNIYRKEMNLEELELERAQERTKKQKDSRALAN